MRGLATTETGRSVRQGVIGFLALRHSLSRTRQWRGQGPGYDPEVWRQFAEGGWLDALVPESAGGAGLGAEVPAAIGDLFGAELVPAPFVALGVLAARVLTLAA